MSKKLALVVHGIGEQEAGETLDALVGGLTGDRACVIKNELRHLRQRNRDHDKDTPERGIKLYPCHIRRVHRGNDTTVFAEAFWGDISRGAQGQVRGLIDLFELVMGLGHIVRENAAEIYDKRAAWPRRGANLFVYLLHGPITAFNLAIALATAALFAMQALTASADLAPSLAVLTAALALVLVYLKLRNPARSYLYQIFRNWMRHTAIMLVAFVVLSHLIAIAIPPEGQAKLSKILVSQCPPSRPFAACMDYWYAALLANVIGATWGVALILVVATGVRETIRRFQSESGAVKTLFPQTMALMMIVWMFLVVVLWAAVSQFVIKTADQAGLTTVNVDIMEKGLLPALNFTFWVVSALAVVSVSAFLAWADRKRWTLRVPPEQHLDRPIRRLIVHPVILIGLTVAIGVLGYGGFETVQYQVQLATSDSHGSFADLLAGSTTYQYFYKAFVPLVALLGLGYTYFGRTLATGIGIAKDIVVYFVRRPDEGTTPENSLKLYPLRAQIQDRFVDTLIQLIRSEHPDEIVVVAHSQGTLVTVEALRGGEFHKRLAQAGLPPINPDLVTMGSPTSHLYSFYFARSFDLANTDPERDVTVGINSWTNIYRVDDFVGTTVDGPRADFPKNLWVNAGGHTNYWTDEMVIAHLKRNGFTEFSGREL